ncbi:hypothetical protein KP509_03G091400 [Ceratopteris richardii]|uniref:WRKY domain-containing protein n=1 Tax=Ceratopteris richardii TaxID=49495 RepID=A0A8T2V5K9_CERRI|nr:hypothetical protein KP509_03G091400 [Ceratopteris richardii]
MAVQVMDYQQGLPSPDRRRAEDELGCDVMEGLQSVQRLLDLLSQSQQADESEHLLSQIVEVATSDLKKFSTLPRRGTFGHARFRQAPPGYVPSSSSSPGPAASPLCRTSSLPSASPSQALCRVSPAPSAPATTSTSIPCSAPSRSPKHADIMAEPTTNSDFRQAACLQIMPTSDASHLKRDAKKDENADGSVYDVSCSPYTSQPQGHARFRDSKAMRSMPEQRTSSAELRTTKPSAAELGHADVMFLRTNSSFLSSVSMEERGGTVSSGKPTYSSGRPPLPPKKRTLEKADATNKKCHGSRQCHCAQKRRKLQKTTVLKMSDISMMTSGIPDDGHSWAPYGQKSVDGSSYPRIYYKCTSVRGCPARKHVQYISEDSGKWIVTYGKRHLHPIIHKASAPS